MRRRLLTIPVLILALTACGNDEPEASAAENNDPVVVTATENDFDPAEITAPAGTSIEVDNEGEAPHNFSIRGEDIDVDIQPGESVSVDTSSLEPGTYELLCKFHSGAGMTGTITIEE